MEKLRSTKVIAMIVVAILVVGYIAFAMAQKSDQVEENEIVRVADLPVLQGLPFYFAMENGYFEEAGIEVERVKFNSPNLIIDALISGKVDMSSPSGAMGIAGIVDFKNPGKLLIYSGGGGNSEIHDNSILVKPDSQITSIEDLKGGRLGILPGIQWRTISKYVLQNYGLEAGVDVMLVELAPGLQVSALVSGQIDALFAIEPMQTVVLAKKLGKKLISEPTLTISDPFYPGAGIIRTEFLKERPEVARKMLEILSRADKEIEKDPENAKKALYGYTPLSDDLVDQAPVLYMTMYDEMTEKDIEAIQKFYDIFTALGVIDGRIDARALIYSPN